MATLKSYDSLKSYLDSLDVDTSNMDNDTLDLQYLDRLKKRNGEALSHDEKLQGNITLKQYLADSQANDITNQGIAKTENTARQQTAYNDYVNSKLAKYLHIAEENNGTAGYTGITQGNRIQLANQEKNIASEIQNTKQNAIQEYLQTYGNQLMSNAQTALAESTQLQGQLDTKRANEEAAAKYEKQQLIENTQAGIEDIIAKWGNLDGTTKRKHEALWEIKEYIDSRDLSDEEKRELLGDVTRAYVFDENYGKTTPKQYSWESVTPEEQEEQSGGQGGQGGGGKTNTYGRLVNEDGSDIAIKSATNGKDISEVSNQMQVFEYTMNGTEYKVRGYTKENLDSMTNAIALQTKKNTDSDKTKIKSILKEMDNGDVICFYSNTTTNTDGKTPHRYFIYKKGDQYYTFLKANGNGDMQNTTNKHKEGFLKIYKYCEDKGLVINNMLGE